MFVEFNVELIQIESKNPKQIYVQIPNKDGSIVSSFIKEICIAHVQTPCIPTIHL
jgi:hypothetical protein